MGAIYVDGGIAPAAEVAERLFAGMLGDVERHAQLDNKSRLQERAQALWQTTPTYEVVAQEGPDHDRRFEVALTLRGREYGRATGRSKKEAEQSAAAQALAALDAGAAQARRRMIVTSARDPGRRAGRVPQAARGRSRGAPGRRRRARHAAGTDGGGLRRRHRRAPGGRHRSVRPQLRDPDRAQTRHGHRRDGRVAAPPRRGHDVSRRGRIPRRTPAVVGDVREVTGRRSGAARLHDERDRVRSAGGRDHRSVRRPRRSRAQAGAGGRRSGGALPRGRPAPDARRPAGGAARLRGRRADARRDPGDAGRVPQGVGGARARRAAQAAGGAATVAGPGADAGDGPAGRGDPRAARRASAARRTASTSTTSTSTRCTSSTTPTATRSGAWGRCCTTSASRARASRAKARPASSASSSTNTSAPRWPTRSAAG